MPGGLSLSRYTRVYNSGDGRLPNGQLTNMPGYLIEPHRARCAPDMSEKDMTLTAARNSVTYVNRLLWLDTIYGNGNMVILLG